MSRNKKSTSSVVMFCLLTAILGLFVYSVKDFFLEGSANAASGLNKAQVEEVVKEVIKNNPELIMDSLRAAQEKSMKDSQDKAQAAIVSHKAEIENAKSSPVAGNVNGDVTIVEFFDYRCGYCKTANKTVQELLQSDKNIKFIYKQLPVLGEDSAYAAKAALTVYHLDKQKFFPFHDKLMQTTQINKEAIAKLVVEVGIDLAKFNATIDKPAIKEELEKTKELAQKINVNGTPAFVINGKFVGGAIDLHAFKNIIEEVRKKK
jgi:protein-disulfide isomerase